MNENTTPGTTHPLERKCQLLAAHRGVRYIQCPLLCFKFQPIFKSFAVGDLKERHVNEHALIHRLEQDLIRTDGMKEVFPAAHGHSNPCLAGPGGRVGCPQPVTLHKHPVKTPTGPLSREPDLEGRTHLPELQC